MHKEEENQIKDEGMNLVLKRGGEKTDEEKKRWKVNLDWEKETSID